MSQKISMSRVTAARMAPGFSAQRMHLMLLVALVGSVLVGQSSARSSFDLECPGMMGNRALYDKVEEVCDDCYNLFRSEHLAVKCRKDCFLNESFFLCLLAMERHSEIKDFGRRLSILNAGRY